MLFKDRAERAVLTPESTDGAHGPELFPPWVKVSFSVAVAAFLPVYWIHQGAAGFLWFYDFALLGAAVALWFELPRLASMVALAVLLPEVGWNVGFFSRLFGGNDLLGLSTYMFDPATPALLRVLSLIHVIVPGLVLWMIHRLRYEPRALASQTMLAWFFLALSYGATLLPVGRIPGTLGVGAHLAQAWFPGWVWLLLAMFAYPALVYIPTHVVLRVLFGKPVSVARRRGGEPPHEE